VEFLVDMTAAGGVWGRLASSGLAENVVVTRLGAHKEDKERRRRARHK